MTVEIPTLTVGLDSNIVTYLAEAMATGYDPEDDPDANLAQQRIAALRVFLHVGGLYVPPTAVLEIAGIRDAAKRQYHEMVQSALLIELTDLDKSAIEHRTAAFLSLHPDEADCRILAESEAAGLSHLLTNDGRFADRLNEATEMTILTPTALWAQLDIPTGHRPRWEPAPANPLAQQEWWRW